MSDHRQRPRRTLVLMRHGHAAGMSVLGDRERPLTELGRREAAEVASELAARGFTPSVVLVSSARRTLDTWQAAAAAGLTARRVEVVDELYNASAAALVEQLRLLPDTADQVLVVAHFPGIPDAVEQLAEGRGSEDSWHQVRWGFPTAAAATLALSGDWADLAEVELVSLDTPS